MPGSKGGTHSAAIGASGLSAVRGTRKPQYSRTAPASPLVTCAHILIDHKSCRHLALLSASVLLELRAPTPSLMNSP
eukprot:3550779-Alexandrium_andersonii.AAC.1